MDRLPDCRSRQARWATPVSAAITAPTGAYGHGRRPGNTPFGGPAQGAQGEQKYANIVQVHRIGEQIGR